MRPTPARRPMRRRSMLCRLGLVALWAVILPLTAQPAPSPPAMTKALFLCRAPHGINQDCGNALVRALVLDARDQSVRRVSDRACPVGREALASLERGH